MSEKESRRTQMTKMLLKTALIELMQAKPFRQITIKELCERADLNRTTFYLHYNDQQSVLKDVEDELIQKTNAFIDESSVDIKTIDLIESFLVYIQNNREMFKTVLTNNPDDEFKMTFISCSLSRIRDNLPVYIDQTSTRYVLTFIMHGCINIIIEWLESDCDLSAKEIAQLIFKLCNDIYKDSISY